MIKLWCCPNCTILNEDMKYSDNDTKKCFRCGWQGNVNKIIIIDYKSKNKT